MDLLGQCHSLLDDDTKATWLLQSLLQSDPLHESSMDLYAHLLRSQHNLAELNRVGHALVRSCVGARENSTQCWAALGIYADAKGNRERACEMMDKAIANGHARAVRSNAPLYDGSLARAYVTRGDILMQGKAPEQAMLMYRRAHILSSGSLRSCQGLVTAHLAVGQIKEAQRFATEAARRYYNNYIIYVAIL